MRVLVAGGSGLLGREITRAALAAGHDVTVLSRSRPGRDPLDPRAAWLGGDVTDAESLAGKLEGHDAVVDAVQMPNSPFEDPKKGVTFERFDLHGTLNLLRAAEAQGVGVFVGLSGVGAAADAPYHWQRLKWEEEQAIQANRSEWVVFRPSWVYGARDVSLNRFLGFARFLPFVPVIGDGRTRINPLFVQDLGEHVAAALTLPAARARVFEIGGPAVLTMDEVVRVALAVAGRRRLLLHQPKWLMKTLAQVVQHLPGRPLTPDSVDFVTMDGVADTKGLEETFGLRLTPLAEGLATYLGRDR
ncbi:MAG: NAD(P)H-binding protein [Dehalococcoidia bacterium]|nr:NAD(P)H-binding protein [Dehalococcoidia bacterium]